MSSDTPAPSWRFLFRPKWLGWHALMVLVVLGMLALGNWQFHRAESGNSLSWAYTFEWPIFAVFVIVFWAKTIKDEFRPPATAEGLDSVTLPAGRDGVAAAPLSGPGQNLRRQAGARSRAPLPGDGLRDRRGADHPVLCRHPAADRRASRGRQQCRR